MPSSTIPPYFLRARCLSCRTTNSVNVNQDNSKSCGWIFRKFEECVMARPATISVTLLVAAKASVLPSDHYSSGTHQLRSVYCIAVPLDWNKVLPKVIGNATKKGCLSSDLRYFVSLSYGFRGISASLCDIATFPQSPRTRWILDGYPFHV